MSDTPSYCKRTDLVDDSFPSVFSPEKAVAAGECSDGAASRPSGETDQVRSHTVTEIEVSDEWATRHTAVENEDKSGKVTVRQARLVAQAGSQFIYTLRDREKSQRNSHPERSPSIIFDMDEKLDTSVDENGDVFVPESHGQTALDTFVTDGQKKSRVATHLHYEKDPADQVCSRHIVPSQIVYSIVMSLLFPPFGLLALFYSSKAIQLAMNGKRALASDRADLACVLNMVGLSFFCCFTVFAITVALLPFIEINDEKNNPNTTNMDGAQQFDKKAS